MVIVRGQWEGRVVVTADGSGLNFCFVESGGDDTVPKKWVKYMLQEIG